MSAAREQGPLTDFLLGLKPLHSRCAVLFVAALLTMLVTLLFRGGLDSFEERVGALGWRLSPSAAEGGVVIVEIDEESLAALGAWPWSHDTFAQLSAALTQAGASLQLYDIVFDTPRDGDAEFLAALQSTNAVLGQLPAVQADAGAFRTGNMTHSLAGISCNANAPAAQGYLAPYAQFASVAKGHIAPIIAGDGSIREVPAYVCVDGQAYPALAIAALLAASDAPWSARVESGSFMAGAEQVLRLDGYPGLAIPLDANGHLRVSYRNRPETYLALSAIDIINGTVDADLLDGAWVIVGGTAFGMDDIVPTPWSGASPGVEVQARILGSLLDDRVPYTPRSAVLWLFALSAAFAAVLLFLANARERFSGRTLAVCAVVMPLAAVALHAQLLASSNLWLGWLFPALFSSSAAGLLILHEYARVKLERSRVLGNLSSYLPTDVAEEIAYSLPKSSIDARRLDATLLSADLRNFSAYGEARPPEESAALLHYFFMRTTGIIEKHRGRVHEFKGDSLLALWDGSSHEAATRALEAAREMQLAMQDVLPQTPPAGLEPLALGIGIEQGPVLIGSIGPAHRRTHTLLGETVTIALRIQEMTAEIAQPILVGECAARQLSDARLESQGSYLLAGLRIPHTLFAPPLQDLQPKVRSANPALKLLHGGRQ